MVNKEERKLRALYENLQGINETTPAQKGSKNEKPSTKGFAYQDEDGNIYHSDVEIASYIDPKTGKEAKVFSYGKDKGLGAKTKKPLAVVSGMSNESARIKRLMRENRRLRQGLRESDDAVKVKRVGSIDPYKVALFQVSGIKNITSYDGIPLYQGLSQGDHDENRFMDTDEIVEWLETTSDDLRDNDSDEADKVDKLIDQVTNEKECLYVIVSELYKAVTTDQVLQVVKKDIELSTCTPDYESAKIDKLMRENRKLRKVLKGTGYKR